jgi:predicted RNase H-like HicB family nuclease
LRIRVSEAVLFLGLLSLLAGRREADNRIGPGSVGRAISSGGVFSGKCLNQPSLQILIWEEDGIYIAKCLDIPGCISDGATRDEALANIHDAIRLCPSVITEDHARPTAGAPEVEIIEARTSDFLETR